jgi:aldehyde dehydrogenase (NAD+)
VNPHTVTELLQHFSLPAADASDSPEGLASYCPGDGSLLGRVPTSGAAGYNAVMSQAVAAARAWADVPAPQRGELVRHIGNELREHKRELAELVSLENGKIKAEGAGRSAGDDRHRRLRGRPVAHALRPHHALGTPQHRMYEQWHPLGVVGVITAFNFPVAVWSWNALLAAICGNATVWKPSPKTPLCALAVQQLCNRVLKRARRPPIFQLFIDRGTQLGHALVDDRASPWCPSPAPPPSAVSRRDRRGAPGQEPARAGRQQRHHRR